MEALQLRRTESPVSKAGPGWAGDAQRAREEPSKWPDHTSPPPSLFCEICTILIPTESSQAQQPCSICSAYLASLQLLPTLHLTRQCWLILSKIISNITDSVKMLQMLSVNSSWLIFFIITLWTFYRQCIVFILVKSSWNRICIHLELLQQIKPTWGFKTLEMHSLIVWGTRSVKLRCHQGYAP